MIPRPALLRLPKPWRVVILTDRPRLWARYADRAAADDVVGKLRRHGFDARIVCEPEAAKARDE